MRRCRRRSGSRIILRSMMSSDYSYFVPLVLIRGDTHGPRAAIMSAIWISASWMPPFTIKHITIILSRDSEQAKGTYARFFALAPVMHEAICSKWPFITKLCRFYSITLNLAYRDRLGTTFEKKTLTERFLVSLSLSSSLTRYQRLSLFFFVNVIPTTTTLFVQPFPKRNAHIINDNNAGTGKRQVVGRLAFCSTNVTTP